MSTDVSLTNVTCQNYPYFPFEKKKQQHIFHKKISLCLKFLFSHESLDFCDKTFNNAHLFSQPSMIIFTKGTYNSDHMCIVVVGDIASKLYILIFMTKKIWNNILLVIV